MKPLNCEHVRDVLPDLLSRKLSGVEEASVQAHLQSCSECRADLAVATVVNAVRLNPPMHLQQRILSASRARRTPAWSGRMALAASVAVAVIGGSVLMQQLLPKSDEVPLASQPAELPEIGAGWFGVDDAFVSGTASLRDLSEAELEKLLAELGS
jgi:predicted anti-sigma-YlaC factor YlaD